MTSCRIAALLASTAAACGFNPQGGAPDGGGTGDDGGNLTRTLRDDAEADFRVEGVETEALVIEPWGALAPIAYHAGGLRAHAANVQLFTEVLDTQWATLAAATPAGTGFMTRSLSGDPPGVGLDSGDSWTYWAEGEIWLDAGTTDFVIEADDQGFLEIATPGDDFVRVANARQGVGTGEYTASAAGWYPVRLAMIEGIGASRFTITLYPDGVALGQALSPDRLRTRVDAMRGMVLAAWDGVWLSEGFQRTLATAPLLDADFGNGRPGDLGLTSDDYWSARWSGQFYAQVAGEYRLRLDSDDGHRLYVNGAVVSDRLADVAPGNLEVDVALIAGWNDLVLDLSEYTGRAGMELEVVSGPEAGLQDELPPARLRPLEPRTERVDTAGDGDDVSIPDNNPVGISKPVPVGALTGSTVAGVDVVVGISHSRVQDLDLFLVHPGGDEVRLRDNSDDGGSGARTWRYRTDEFDDTPAGGIWHVRLADTVNGNSGSITDVRLAVHHHNGPDQLARSASFTSLVRDLGAGVVALDAVRVGGHSPTPEGIVVRLRGCDAPEQCAAESWSEPLVGVLDAAGAVPGVPPRRYLQYRVELTSNGEREPEVDWIEVSYRVPPP